MKEFPPFRLDVVNQCLWREGERIALTPKAFSVLQYLVQHAGQLVTQNELLDALWSESFVQPEVLKSHILDVRAALGDDAKHPSFIETMPRRGYRFIAKVQECVESELASSAEPKIVVRDFSPVDFSNGAVRTRESPKELSGAEESINSEQAPRRKYSTRRSWIAGGALLASGAGLGRMIPLLRRHRADERALRFQIEAAEGGQFVFGANTGGIAMSPDGMTAAYVASNNGKTGLWVRPLDLIAARLVPGTEGAFYPFWSPDNKSIAFFTSTKLERVEQAGGSPLAICEVALARGGAWTSDGLILFATVTSGLFQVPASGGTPSPLTVLDASHKESSHRWPQVLPGGRFLYWAQSDQPGMSAVYAASFAKPNERVRLLATDNNVLYARGNDEKDYLLWLRGAALFAQEFDVGALKFTGEPHPVADPVAGMALTGQMNVAVSRNGMLLYSDSNSPSQLTWFDRSGKSLGVIGEAGEYSSFRLSPDGGRAVVSRDRSGATELLLVETERGVFNRFTSNTATNIFPVWSPDGRTIVFTSGNSRNLFRKDSSGAGSEQRITQSPSAQGIQDWSRDGRLVLYFELEPRSQLSLWSMPVTPDGRLAAGSSPQPYLRTPFRQWWARFSPEASPQWVAYQSDESGRWEVYIQAFPEPRGATRISTRGGQFPQWSPHLSGNVHELFYVSLDYKLMAVSVKLGADSMQPSAPRELFQLPATDTVYCPYEVAPDGRRFLVRAKSEHGTKPLTIIANWTPLLKKTIAP
ncbi:MAG: winged helix-turn-helix domain-containing protein [Bryobacteraceae bacterium]